MTLKDFFGFSWYLLKAMSKPFGVVMYFSSLIGMNALDAPYSNICAGIVILCVVFWFWPMTKEILKREYEQYRAKKEEAWNILKETK